MGLVKQGADVLEFAEEMHSVLKAKAFDEFYESAGVGLARPHGSGYTQFNVVSLAAERGHGSHRILLALRGRHVSADGKLD